MADQPPKNPPRSDATLPIPPELARDGGGERFGRFQLSKRLGAGVAHDLWHAWDPERKEWLALRVWPRPPAGMKEKVLAAGKKSKAAGDPRIVAPAGGGLEAGQLWYARPYFEALPVRDIPWLDGRTLATIAREVAQALAAAHAKGLAHGRLSAGNVLVVSRESKAGGGRRSPKGEGGWEHQVKVTEFGLEDGDAVGDVRGLGRIFCELTGQPSPGGGPTTKAAPSPAGETTDLSKVKGDTTRDASSEGRIAIDGALAGIFLRARDGQLTSAAMDGELGAWLGRGSAAAGAGKGKWIAIAAGVAAVALIAIVVLSRRAGGDAAKPLSESAAAEAAGRLEPALELARAALAADPNSAAAAEAVKRLEAAVTARNASITAARDAEAAGREADRRVVEARAALNAAEAAAGSGKTDRALLDRLLAPVLDALGAALRARPGHPPALRLLEQAATLLQPGDLARLPKTADGQPLLSPALVLRADLQAWALSCFGPHGLAVSRRGCPDICRRIGLYPPPAPLPGSTLTPLPSPDPAAPGRVARLVADGPAWEGQSPSAAAWHASARALLSLDPAAALRIASSVRPAPGDPFAPDLAWIRGAADPAHAVEHFRTARDARPWDPLFAVSLWLSLRLECQYREALSTIDGMPLLHPSSTDVRLARAWSLYTLRREDDALAECEAAQDRDPAALVTAAFVRYVAGHVEDAERDCTEALRREPALVAALVLRAQLRERLQKLDASLEDADAAVALDPDSLDALHLRAEYRSRMGDRAGALADCERALRISPGDPETFRIRGWIYVYDGDYEKALVEAELAIGASPSQAGGLILRAYVNLLTGKDALAVKDAEQALELESRSATAWVVLGTASLNRGDSTSARDSCEKALRLSPGLTMAVRLRARIEFLHHNFSDAVADATQVLAAYPRDLTMLHVRASSRLQQGAFSGALEDCEKMLSIDPRNAEALVLRARVKTASRAPGSAAGMAAILDDLDRALALAPKNLEALDTKALVLSIAGRNREAADAMTRALEASPSDAGFRARRGRYRELAGDANGALEDADELIKSAPKSAAGFQLRSSLMAKKGDLETAMLDAIDGTRAEPANPGIWRQLGDVYRAKGVKDRALEAYEKAVKSGAQGDPDRTLAEAAIAKLKEK